MRQMLKNKFKEQKGFTLIELLAVIVILGIIAAIAIPSITKIIQNSRIDSLRADAVEVYNAGKLYSSQHENDSTFDQDNLGDVLDHTSLTTYKFYLLSDGTLLMDAAGTAGSVTLKVEHASFNEINEKDNWKPTSGKITITGTTTPPATTP